MKKLIAADKSVKGAKVAILGFTFKENCPDTRNTKVIDIINELKEYGISPRVCDPQADKSEALRLYGLRFDEMNTIKEMDAIIIAVAHKEFTKLTIEQIDRFYGCGNKVLIDIKGILDSKEFINRGYSYWRL